MFIMCFPVSSRVLYHRTRCEIERAFELDKERRYAPRTVLVGTYTGLRDCGDPRGDDQLVLSEEGAACAKELGIAAYAEVGSRTGRGVKTLILTCAELFVRASSSPLPLDEKNAER